MSEKHEWLQPDPNLPYWSEENMRRRNGPAICEDLEANVMGKPGTEKRRIFDKNVAQVRKFLRLDKKDET